MWVELQLMQDSEREGNERRLGCSHRKNAVRKNEKDEEPEVFLLLIE